MQGLVRDKPDGVRFRFPKEKRDYADGLSPLLMKRWYLSVNSGAGVWKTVRTAAHLLGVIGHVAAEREP